uniref:Mediator of RNA polymerase II transcription subunit 1 n=1 Tax=Noccaea caerulescens TaxID=107243 RepID=A0A1J3EWZ8_NOCCA
MDKGEPSLVPEWLRISGHASGGGSSNHLLVSSSSHSDSASLQQNSRNRNSRSKSDVDSIHSPFLDRSSSTNSRRGTSNGSGKHAYSSFNFNRSQRDKDRMREKDRSYVDQWDLDTCIPLRNIVAGRDQDQLRRSHSMVTRKQGDHLSRGLTVGLKNGGSSTSYNGNGILPGPSIGNSFQRTGFDKDFPSLGADEKHGGQDVVRVSSPGLSSAVQSLPVGNSALIGGEGWTSALAEVPNVIEKACAGSLTSPKANIVSTGTLPGPTGLNMAEALVQAPARTRTPPQGSGKTQREDLAIKQSRQLIPVVPSAPKCSILNSSDKSKTKQVVRTGETCLAHTRNSQQQPSVLLGNFQSNPSGQIKSEKKLLVLKPARENGVHAVKESGSPSGNPNSRPASSQLMNTTQSTQSAPVRSTNSPKELKGATTFTMASNQTIEKKSSLAQTQSRNAFYSALKRKSTSTSISSDSVISTANCISSSVEEKANSSKELVASDPSSPQATSGVEVTQRNTIGFEEADTPDEKEAEFLRSLGWEENSGEDEALTEEEIKAFFEQYEKMRPSHPQKLSVIQEAREDVA